MNYTLETAFICVGNFGIEFTSSRISDPVGTEGWTDLEEPKMRVLENRMLAVYYTTSDRECKRELEKTAQSIA